MRSSKLSAAIGAVATLLVLAPAGALAAGTHPHPKRSGVRRHAHAVGCRVSLFAEPHTVTVGDSAQLFGALNCPGSSTNATSQVVTIYEHSAGAGGFRTIGTATTGPGGFYSMPVPSITTNSTFFAVALGVRSPTRAVKAEPLVTFEGPKTASLITGVANRATFSGSVSPADVGAAVVLQREEATTSEEWKEIGRGLVKAGGHFSIAHTFSVPGAAEIRVVVRPHGRFTLRGVSESIPYVISQRENPLLTLESTAEPLLFPGATALKGTLHNGGGQKVTLWARNRVVLPFAKVTEAMAGSSGEYSFPQAPQHNTEYRVTGGGLTSAVLFEGVKYALEAGVSSSKAQVEQPLVFSGKVSPAVAGKVVYLERQNKFGHGYHVANVGVVGPGGAYSITHRVFGPGTDVFRVHVPGDHENVGTSSAPFTIEVTPAPPGSLRPVAQPRFPSEGTV